VSANLKTEKEEIYWMVCFVCQFHCVLLHSSWCVNVKISGILW